MACLFIYTSRMTLGGGEMMLGDFIRFDGCDEDIEALKLIKRAHVREMRVSINEEHKCHLLRKGLSLAFNHQNLIFGKDYDQEKGLLIESLRLATRLTIKRFKMKEKCPLVTVRLK